MLETKINNFIKARSKYFQQLLRLSSNFHVWAENNGWSSWQPITTFSLNELANNTNLHREILPIEWVFDIDGDNWKSVRKLAVELEKIFEKYGIVFNRWSSGNWLHYHVFVDNSEIAKTGIRWEKELLKFHFGKLLRKNKISINEVVEFYRKVHKSIPLLLLEELKQTDGAHVDLSKFTSSRCLIRAEGSLNLKTKAYKTYLEELPKEKPLTKASWNVKFPEKIKVWKPDVGLYNNLFLTAYWEYVKPQYEYLLAKPKPIKERGKIEWIEKLLQTPLEDGRKRAVNLILAPYFMNVLKVDEQSALPKIMEWLRKCDELRPTRIAQNYVLYQLRYAKKRKLKVLSKKKLKDVFADVPQIKLLHSDIQ